jgi:hypothetical protein
MAFSVAPIEAHEQNIGQIFSDSYAFEIPPYQRPYAWEKDQAQELLSDLLEAMDNKNSRSDVYFLGSIVLIKSPNDPSSRVIDGQQRLTTLTILLSVLRDLTSNQEVSIERRAYIFQKASADRGTEDRFRLLLRHRDRPFFQKYIQNHGATTNLPDINTLQGSQKRVAENAEYFRGELERLAEDRRNALVAFIIQRCYLVIVAVPTAESARRIFTVLNARGLDLTPTDILKADLLERAGEAREADLADRWEAVEQSLGRERMVELFGHIRMMYERDKPRLALEAGFPKFVEPFGGNADSFIGNILEPIADALRLLDRSNVIIERFGLEAAKAIRSLERIDNKDWVPPVLFCLWKQLPGGAQSTGRFLIDLERVAYFLFITRAGVNERIERFAAIMDELDPRPTKERPTKGLNLSPLEQNDFLEGIGGSLYEKSRVCKPVMQRLDEALSAGGASYDNLVSIEHVLPQTVEDGSEWASLFPDEKQRSEWTHRLANLVFLTHRINSRASNWSFEKKKKEYFGSVDGSSPFPITQGVLQADKWTPEFLADRQQKLVEKLAEIWKVASYPDLKDDPDDQYDESGWDVSDHNVIKEKRTLLVNALNRRDEVSLIKKSGALYADNVAQLHAVCAISKRHGRGAAHWYWYGYSPRWRSFLAQAKSAFLVLGCTDRNTAYPIQYEQIEKIRDDLHRTPGKHWHIILEEDDRGELYLIVPKTESKMSLRKFELKLDAN